MRKLSLNYIIVLISSALLVLVGLQLFQAKQLFDQTTIEVHAHIENMLGKVAIRHEKAADFKRYTSIFDKDFSGQYKTALKQEFQNLVPVQESVSIRDTFVNVEGKKVKYLLITGKSYDSISDLTASHSVLARDVSEMSQLIKIDKNRSKKNDDLQFELDKRVINNLFKKSKYVNELLASVFRSSTFLPANQRIDLAFLDSIIAKTFEYDEFVAKYNYLVLDENSKPVEFPAYTDKYNLGIDTTSSFSVRLFPGNIFDEQLTLHLDFPNLNSVLFNEMWLTLVVSLFLVVLVIVSFYVMFKTILNQRRLAEIKNDFISNMTHEFKTPISTISLACEAMTDKDLIGESNIEPLAPFVKMVNDENKRLGSLVERILQSAVLDKGEIKLKREKLELNEIVANSVSKSRMRIEAAHGTIDLNLDCGLFYFKSDMIHTTNIINNLLDNAIKYSKEAPQISVKTKKLKDSYQVIVTDKGIGIKNEHLDRIFEKLYRVPTGNVHDVKGFGLGLSYVKAIVDMEGWSIDVSSKFGEGSTFILTLNKIKNDE